MGLKPFIAGNVHYQSEQFQYKFLSSFLKLLTLKNCFLTRTKSHHSKDFFESVHEKLQNFVFIKTQLNKEPLGFVALSPALVAYMLEKSMGGSSAENLSSRELSKIDLAVIDNFSGVFSLSVREGLKAFIGKNLDVESLNAKSDLFIRDFIDREAFFVESFVFKDKDQANSEKMELILGLKVDSFKKRKS